MRALILSIMAICLGVTSTRAQGEVAFYTKVSNAGVDAKFFDCLTGLPATSPGYVAALEIDDGFGNFSLVPGTVTQFRPGPAAGYVVPIAATIPGHECGSRVKLRVVAFNGASEADFASATQIGFTYPVSVHLSCGSQLPAPLEGLQGTFCVPEPSAIALALCGAVVFALRRHKKK
jgi:hypothetical protein